MVIELSERAAAVIRTAGGRVYFWQEEVGRAWMLDKVAFTDPNVGERFTAFYSGDVQILIAPDVMPPESLRIGTRSLRRGRLRIEWDGKTWGERGASDGGGG